MPEEAKPLATIVQEIDARLAGISEGMTRIVETVRVTQERQFSIQEVRATIQTVLQELRVARQTDLQELRATTRTVLQELRVATQTDLQELHATTEKIAAEQSKSRSDIMSRIDRLQETVELIREDARVIGPLPTPRSIGLGIPVRR